VDLRAEARSMQSDLAELRRKFHREPEIGLDLPHTQERVLEALSSLPLEIELLRPELGRGHRPGAGLDGGPAELISVVRSFSRPGRRS
jgi:metal-dependent amidase/aminoacylase/carboxypeptidase family protein